MPSGRPRRWGTATSGALDDGERAELDAALTSATTNVDDVVDLTPATVPLPTLAPKLAAFAEELVDGRGVGLIRTRTTAARTFV